MALEHNSQGATSCEFEVNHKVGGIASKDVWHCTKLYMCLSPIRKACKQPKFLCHPSFHGGGMSSPGSDPLNHSHEILVPITPGTSRRAKELKLIEDKVEQGMSFRPQVKGSLLGFSFAKAFRPQCMQAGQALESQDHAFAAALLIVVLASILVLRHSYKQILKQCQMLLLSAS
jgi:hypothetical protein